MDSLVVFVDNCKDNSLSHRQQWSNQLSLVDMICRQTYLRDNRNRISIMKSSPPIVVQKFTANITSIQESIQSLNDIRNSISTEHDFDLIRCLCFGRKQLQNVNSLRKSMVILIRSPIEGTPLQFTDFAQDLAKECSIITVDLILFDFRVYENYRKILKLKTGIETDFLRVYRTTSKVIEGLVKELTSLHFFDPKLINAIQNRPIGSEQCTAAKEVENSSESDIEVIEPLEVEEDIRKAIELSYFDNLKDISDRDKKAIIAAINDLKPSDSVPKCKNNEKKAMNKEEVINWFANEENKSELDLDFDAMSDPKISYKQTEVNTRKEKLKNGKLDENAKKLMEDTIRQTEESLEAMELCDKKTGNLSKPVTEDDLAVALRLSMIENYKIEGIVNPNDMSDNGSEEEKKAKKKVKKFKEGNEDE